MATVENTRDTSASGNYTLSPLLSSASVISSISDIHSVSEPALVPDTTVGIDQQHGRCSPSMSLKSNQALKPHSRYYLHDGMIDIAIQDTVFRIPRSIFAQNSTPFSNLVQAHDHLNAPEYNSSTLFIEDEDVTSTDFERLLDVLYPLTFGDVSVTTLEEWTSVLHLASKWSFCTIRVLAIERLFALTSPVDKVVLGRKYDIHEWLLDAYVSLCERADPLTLEEGLRMTTEDIIKIGEGWHRVRVYSGLVAPDSLRETVGNLFDVSPTNSKESASVRHTPESPPEPPSSKSKLASLITSSASVEGVALEPLDLVRVTRLIKVATEQNSTVARAGLRSILLPYHAQPNAMDAVLKIISDQVIDQELRHLDLLRDIVMILSEIINSACTDGLSAGPSGESLSGRPWLVDRLISYCTAAVDGWSIPTSGSETWKNVYAVTKFLSALVDVGLITNDVFTPLWEAIVRMSERPAAEWAHNAEAGYLADGFIRKIQVPSCSLLIDDFYHRIQVCELEYEGQPDYTYNQWGDTTGRTEKYYILPSLQKIAASRI